MSLLLLPISGLPRPLSGFHRFAIFVSVALLIASVLVMALGVLMVTGSWQPMAVYYPLALIPGALVWGLGRAVFWLLTGR